MKTSSQIRLLKSSLDYLLLSCECDDEISVKNGWYLFLAVIADPGEVA
jgi:hypothetical protein